MIKSKLSVLVFICLLLPLSALAQNSSGLIEGQIDGEDMQWHVTSQDGRSQSDWTDFGPLASVNIFAHPTSDTTSAIEGAFLIGFQVFNLTADEPTVAEPEITYMQDGYSGMYGAQDSATVSVQEILIDDGRLRIKGSFETSLTYSTDHLRTFDADNSKQATGQFDVTLGTIPQ